MHSVWSDSVLFVCVMGRMVFSSSNIVGWMWNDPRREAWLCVCLSVLTFIMWKMLLWASYIERFFVFSFWSSFKSLCWWRCQPFIWRHRRREGEVSFLSAVSVTSLLLLSLFYFLLSKWWLFIFLQILTENHLRESESCLTMLY